MLNQAYAVEKDTPQIPELRRVHERLRMTIEELTKTGSRMESALDRVHGSRPHPVRDAKVSTIKSESAISVIDDALADLSNLKGVFHELANRMDSIA
jgi:hypothetical protein